MSCARFDAGAEIRREVLGDEYVSRSEADRSGFTDDFRQLGTEYAWGAVWARPGLDRRTRSVITLSTLAAGGHYEEFALHVRGALNNGLTPDEIKEVILHLSVYCGFPTANHVLAIARDVLDEWSQS